MLNIDKLLKKKGWTGSELGRLEIITMLQGYSQALQGKSPQTLVSKSDFQKMLDTIKDPAEGAIYNGYIAIHQWLAEKSSLALAHEQQAQLQYNKLANILSNAITAEKIYTYISELPAIMTEKQYKDLVESRKKEILHPNGEDIGFNIFNMLEQALLFYVLQLQKEPRKKNPLKPLKKKLEQELVTDARILSRYNEVMGNGYYEREDGTRSDKVPSEEWVKLTPVTEDPEAQFELKLKRKCFIDKKIMEEGLTQEEAENELEKVPELAIFIEKPATWHYYDNPPEDLNKWEILETGDLFEYYPALAGEGTDEEQIADIEAFKEEFPELVDTLLKDMEKYYKGISTLSIQEWLNTVYMWEDLYKVDFYGFKSNFVESDTTIFDGNYRAIFNGIAILKPSDLLNKSPRIDPETGYYTAPDILESLSPISLTHYFTDNEDYTEKADAIEDLRQTLLESLYFLNGFNYALDLIAIHFNLEEIAVAKIPINGLIDRIEAFNSLVAMLYKRIKNIAYDDNELKEKKLGVLKDILYPIDTDCLTIPEENINRVKLNMKEFKAFKDHSLDPLSLLCYKEWGL